VGTSVERRSYVVRHSEAQDCFVQYVSESSADSETIQTSQLPLNTKSTPPTRCVETMTIYRVIQEERSIF
jgi:hypothetical protein